MCIYLTPTFPCQSQAIQVVLRDQVLPFLSLQAKQRQRQQQQEQQQPPAESTAIAALRELPLGFETGIQPLDDACRVLRLLHVRDLRELQSAIDSSIVATQEFVANPKTDSTLGRVGV